MVKKYQLDTKGALCLLLTIINASRGMYYK